MKIYKGRRIHPEQETASDVIVTVEEGRKETPLKHHVYHSPTGFCWGYGGSGPADLALSILWDFFGAEPITEMYMDFKWNYVAIWEAEWQINSEEIGNWVNKWHNK